MDGFKNFAKVTVADGNYDDSVTEIDVATGQGVRLPQAPFNAVWWNATDYPDPSDDPSKEIVRVTDVTDDTLTIERDQEFTGAFDHNEAGKTYNLANTLTAKMISDLIALLGDVFGSGTAILVDVGGETIELRQSAAKGITIGASTTIEDTVSVDIGDPRGEGNSSFLSVSDQNQRATFVGLDIATDRTASATLAVGTLVAKLAIRDASGTIIGYLPIYGSIT